MIETGTTKRSETMSVKSWMRKNSVNYIDKLGELNMTQMAEDCAIDLLDRNAEEAEFFAAFEISEELGL